MILSVSRAIGETAPLVVVGAATVIFTNPTGPFSKFTVLPIQIFRWTADPRAGFQDAAAATIIVLLTMLIALNATAIILRNYYSSKEQKVGISLMGDTVIELQDVSVYYGDYRAVKDVKSGY